MTLLSGWDNFLVIVGSAAAGLTGLTFIVITLMAQRSQVNATGLRVFITPTIVHFSSVLGLAAFLSMPRLSAGTLSVCIGCAGVGGFIYLTAIARNVRAIKSDYVPVKEDWIWNVIIPVCSYGTLLASAVLLRYRPAAFMYGVAVALMLLIFTGIHNSWDIAVWNTIRRPGEKPAPEGNSRDGRND